MNLFISFIKIEYGSHKLHPNTQYLDLIFDSIVIIILFVLQMSQHLDVTIVSCDL